MNGIGGLCDRLEELALAATPGPWEQDIYEVMADRHRLVAETGWRPDAALIVAAVNALPDLIAAARERDRLRAAVDGLAEELEADGSAAQDRARVSIQAAARLRAAVADTTGEA